MPTVTKMLIVDERPELPAFTAALKPSNHGLNQYTWARYLRGEWPSLIYWLAEHPDLLNALRADAAALAATRRR